MYTKKDNFIKKKCVIFMLKIVVRCWEMRLEDLLIAQQQAKALFLISYNREEKESVLKEIDYFYGKYANYITICKEDLWQRVAKLIQKKAPAESIQRKIRDLLISEIQRNAVKKGDMRLYKAFYSDLEKKILGYVDKVKNIQELQF